MEKSAARFSVLRENGPIIANAALFQVTWFACVIGGAAGQPIWGYVGVVALLLYSMSVGFLNRDLGVLLVLGLVGFGVDTLWIVLGILDFNSAVLAPSWIVALWLGFALTVNHSLGWLRQKPLLAAVLAAAAAPMTYVAGARLGAVEILEPAGLLLISAVWGLMFFVLFALVRGELRGEEAATAAPARISTDIRK